MLSNYLKISWRHQMKNKAYFFINVFGLATGMAITLLIGLWITDEITFDHYHTNHSRIAKGMIAQTSQGHTYDGDVVSVPMDIAFQTQFKDIFKRVGSMSWGGGLFTNGDVKIGRRCIWASSQFTEMFTFKMEEGSASAIADPTTAIISRSFATALFGKTDPMGKTFMRNNKQSFKVGGVYEDFPRNNTFYDVSIVLPWTHKDNNFYYTNT